MNIELFKEEVKKLGIELTDKQLLQLEKFYHLLLEWNKVMNLTRITKQEEVYLKHFYDSLTLYKVIDFSKEISVCDVGSGAGFPGIVLKIVFPKLKITLIDSLQKRVNYLNTIIRELELTNSIAIHTRAEEYAKNTREQFDVVTARAVANLQILLEICIPLVKQQGLFVAMKGNSEEELKQTETIMTELKVKTQKIETFYLPEEQSIRNLIVIKKEEKTPMKYPRTMDKIKKTIQK